MTKEPVEWLEPDALGGFASGTSALVRTRRYHGLLLVATTPPTGRTMLVNGLEAWVDTPAGRHVISSQVYAPDVVYPDGQRYLASFVNDPWPRWTFILPGDIELEHELFVPHGASASVLTWRLVTPRPDLTLSVRLLLSGRDYHSTHRENGAFRFDAAVEHERITWAPYEGVPPITALANATYEHQPDWYRNFLYREEQTRGLDCVEDLASPGTFTWDLSSPAVLVLTAGPNAVSPGKASAGELAESLRDRERGRRVFSSPLERAAEAYFVSRGSGKTIVAGYPWFTDWGRDTFIALRGLCIATGRLDDAKQILLEWARVTSEGMLPNRFPDNGDVAEFNSVDASLWYVIAVGELLDACEQHVVALNAPERQAFQQAVDEILDHYRRGTRYGIRLDRDALLACGEPGVQLTWMDAKIGDWVVTPRVGKPVEIQALWLNALAVASRWTTQWIPYLEQGTAAFKDRFWSEERGYLYDVVDVDHHPGRVDAAFRPNQIFAVGGLPRAVLTGPEARKVVAAVEARLLTPKGLRSLAPDEPGYRGRYQGSPCERDARYHQGTAWPWLLGAFAEAWIRVQGSSPRTRRDAHARFLLPLLQLAQDAGGHLPEIADGDSPHISRGCPAQAWSVGEALRLQRLLSPPPRRHRRRPKKAGAVV